MSEDFNTFEVIKSYLSKKTLQDIESLDPFTFGFEREECCGPIPESLSNSMRMDREYILLASSMPFREWNKFADNVPFYTQLRSSLQISCPKAAFFVCEANCDECVLRFRVNPDTEQFEITQYSIPEPIATPWNEKGVLRVDRTDEIFILVCAHLSRDKRCGYCGAILVDLFLQTVARKIGEAKRVSVLPMSHVGGHAYAGNVIVFDKSGGTCFGLFKPKDVGTLVDALVLGTFDIPESLQPLVRGRLYVNTATTEYTKRKCAIM